MVYRGRRFVTGIAILFGILANFAVTCRIAAQASGQQAASFDAAAERWNMALRKAASPQNFQQIAEESLIQMDAAVNAGRFDAAASLAKTAVTAAGKSAIPLLRQEAVARKKVLDEVLPALKTAAARANANLEANLVLGKYLCFIKGDWEVGIGKLMMCSDDGLKDMAWKTSLVEDEPAAQVALGDIWWELSTKTGGRSKAEYQAGAAHLYLRALPQLKPPDSDLIRRRLEESARNSPGGWRWPSVLDVPLADGESLRLRRMPSGKIVVGSPANEVGRQPEEIQKTETIEKPFYIGITEVTQRQWSTVLRQGSPGAFVGEENLPAHGISWNQAQRFVDGLNSKRIGRQYRFRLPTPAEWEYACRAGTTTAYYFGNDGVSLADYAWQKSNSGDRPHPVGQLLPNAWGLFDMLGNVEEWTDAAYDLKRFPSRSGEAIFSSDARMTRGGSFAGIPSQCRTAALGFTAASVGNNRQGLRIVCDVLSAEAALKLHAK
ncbi:MAG: formylglycine-generating enzyme family protein [Planctomycetes bacterium]|nr:formylglycine-generating enzyme family protein [Planctomycetota bacterium]